MNVLPNRPPEVLMYQLENFSEVDLNLVTSTPSLAEELEKLRALPDVPDAFRLFLFGLEIVLSFLSLVVLHILSYTFIRCRGIHLNLRIIFVHMNVVQFVERVVRIIRVTDITLHWIPIYEGQQVENIRRWLWWYCNLAYVFVITERIIATVNFSEYERWGTVTSLYVLIASYLSGGAFYYVSQFVSDNFTQLAMKVMCVTLPWLALHLCEQINIDLSSFNRNLSLSARFQISENISTLASIRGWIYVSATMNLCISSIMCCIWYVITPNHLLYGLHVISNLFDMVIAFYVLIYPIVIISTNNTMRNMVKRLLVRKDEKQVFHKKNAIGIAPMSLYPPTTDEYFRVLNEGWNLLSNPQPNRKWFNFKTSPKWIRVL